MSTSSNWSTLLEVPLTPEEGRRISVRLGADLVGLGLLTVGVGMAVWSPSQAQVAAIVQALAAIVVATPVWIRAARGLARPTALDHTDQLVALAVLAAMASGQFITATLVPVLLEVGRLFEERSALGAQAAIEGIRGLRAHTARRRVDDGEEEVALSAIGVGDVVVVRPGDLLPVDGTVQVGRSSVDQSPVTGESRYETVTVGSSVFAGTLNLDGLLEVSVERVGEATVLGRVVDLLREVEASKTPALRLLERYGAAYLPVVLAIAATVWFWTEDVERAIAILVVSTPTALVLAGPAAMVAAMTVATRRSILVKSAAFLERIAHVDTLILDKTGTVTLGRQVVRQIRVSDVAPDEALRLAAAAGQGSLHPVSRAVVAAAEAQALTIPRALETTEHAGKGVEAQLGNHIIRLGNLDWLRALGVTGTIQGEGSGAWVARDDTLIARIDLYDQPRPEGPEVVAAMRELGLDRTVLLTGDRQEVAAEVGAQLGVDEVVAEVLPEGKLDIVRKEQATGRVVLMVGDGVNDALALSGADVGVAIGARMNEVALGGADVALMTEDLRRLPEMVQLADRTRWTTTTNAAVGVGFSVVMVGLASLGIIPPLWGAILHNLGAFFVVGNSARLLNDEGQDGLLNSAEADVPSRLA
ncbi:MAG: cation-translocating P-type ATPase [Myxococcota bacterium]